MINKQQTGKKASFTIEPGADDKGTTAILCLPVFNREIEPNIEFYLFSE